MPPYRKCAGDGKFTFEDGYIVSAAFTLECETNGNIFGLITPAEIVDARDIEKRIRSRCRLEGKLANRSCRIICERLMVYGSETSITGSGMSVKLQFVSEGTVRLIENELPQTGVVQIRFGLTNFIFLGNLHARMSGSQFVFRLEGKYSRLQESLMNSGSEICTTVEVISPPQRVQMLLETMQGAALLLSLARGTFVAVAFMEIAVNGAHVQSEIWLFSVNRYRDDEPLLEWKTVSNLSLFLQSGIVAYQSLRSKLKLDSALRYCVFAKTMRGPLELKFVTVFIALESLLLRLESLGIAKIKISHGKKTSLVLRRLRAGLRYYKLNDRLGVSKEKPAPNFAKIRNDIVHTGSSPHRFDTNRAWRSYTALIDLYQCLLLAILTYNGEYVDCTNRYLLRKLD